MADDSPSDKGKYFEGQLIKAMDQTHGRAVHSVVLPTISDYTSLPNNIYDVFLSSSTDGTIKLWDLRAACKCVRTFQEHTNRVQNTQQLLCISVVS